METIAYGDRRIEVGDAHGAKILPGRYPARGRVPVPRTGGTAPEARGALLGRDVEVAAVDALLPGERIEFHAPCGFGKSTLLEHVAGRLRPAATTPVVFLDVAGYGLDDVRHSLLGALYTLVPGARPTPSERAHLLRAAHATIVLDDVTLGPDKIRQLLDDLPHCTVILGCDRPVLGRRGRSMALSGLPEEVAHEQLRRDLGRELTSAESRDAQHLCEVVDHQPLRLRQAAALVREGGHTFADLVSAARSDTFALDRLSVNALSTAQRQALAVLALAAGTLIPGQLVGLITDLHDIGTILGSLHRRGLAQEQKDRFGLPVCHADDYRALLLEHLALGDAVRTLTGWLAERDPTADETLSAADAAMSIIGYAAERAEWPAVVRLVEVIEPILALAGRWDAWREALGSGMQAAQALGDVATWARLAHQLGVLEYLDGHTDAARNLWQRVARDRERTGDHAGAAATRANLALLDAVVPPPQPAPTPPGPPSGPRGTPSIGDQLPGPAASVHKRTWAAVAVIVLIALFVPLARAATSHSQPGHRSSNQIPGNPFPGTGNPVGVASSPAGDPGTVRSSAADPGTTRSNGESRRVTAQIGNLRSDPATYHGVCPVTVTFSATLGIDSGPGTVTYRWIGSEGRVGTVKTARFNGSGPQSATIQTRLTFRFDVGEYAGWEAVEVLSPNPFTSEQASYSGTCNRPPTPVKVSVSASATPDKYTGDCSAGVSLGFSAVISVDRGPVTVTFRWVINGTVFHDDSVTFSGTGPAHQTVGEGSMVYNSSKWYGHVEILQPVSLTSNDAVAEFLCK